MKKPFSCLIILQILFLFSSCNKDRNQILLFDFSTPSDLEEWNVIGDGTASIDSGVIYFSNISSCFHLDLKELIDIRKNRSYKIKISSKNNPSQIGNPAYCLGNLMVGIKQDGETILMEGTSSGLDFTEQQYTFTTISASPIQLKLMVGTINGAWVDHISIEKAY